MRIFAHSENRNERVSHGCWWNRKKIYQQYVIIISYLRSAILVGLGPTMKPVYKPPSFWQRLSNATSYTLRIAAVLSFGVFLLNWPIIHKGLKNYAIIEQKNKWIRDEVRDVNNTHFARLDIEDEPVPLVATKDKGQK